jgi:hypothetical protein
MTRFVRGRLGALLAALATMLLAATAAADPYTITGVKVQASGSKPELARAKAIAEGEIVAYNRLLRRLTLAQDHGRLPRPAADSVRAAVLNFSIESETGEGERYAATITYRFNREAVRGVLEGVDVPFVDTPSPPIVVLPVWAHEGKPLLWDDPNPWREAWLRHEAQDALAEFARVRGDLDDLKAVSAEEAAAANRAALNRIADKYKAGLVVVAYATLEKDKRRIALRLFDLANGRTTGLGVVAAGEDAAALDKAAAQVARVIDAAWKHTAVALEQNATVVRIRVPLEGLDHWIRVRQALQGMTQLRGFTTVSMSPGEALVELRFAGTMAELRRQLEQKGMSIVPDPAAAAGAEAWVLKTQPVKPGVKETDLPPPGEAPPAKGDERKSEKPEPPKKP